MSQFSGMDIGSQADADPSRLAGLDLGCGVCPGAAGRRPSNGYAWAAAVFFLGPRIILADDTARMAPSTSLSRPTGTMPTRAAPRTAPTPEPPAMGAATSASSR